MRPSPHHNRAVAFTAGFAVAAAVSLWPLTSAVAQATPPAEQGDRGPAAVELREDYGDHFLHYDPLVARRKPLAASAPAPAAVGVAASASQPAAAGESKVTVEWLRANYPALEERAMDNPSPVNVRAAAYVKRIVLDKASRYANAMQEAVLSDPLLNENSRIPYASMGAAAVRNADLQAQGAAVRQMSKAGGLLVFVDAHCRFCKAQLPILDYLHREYGMEYLLVSIDGATIPGTSAPVIRDTGLFSKLGLKLTPSMVFVPSPTGYRGSDPNTYLVVSQGFYTADDLVKQISFAGYQKRLLADATMRDLAVWDRGILATTDLDSLRLDPTKPESIPAQIQPLLMKRY